MSVRRIESVREYEKMKSKGVVIVDYNTVWCGPCKKFAPVFEEIAAKYPDTIFLSVDPEMIEHEDCMDIATVPTFRIFINGEKKREFSGVDRQRIERYADKYQYQIFYNGSIVRTFSEEEKKKIVDYMEKFSTDNVN